MSRRRNVLTVVTAVIIVAIFVLYMITYVVREGEVAVLTTFKKVVRVVDRPGLYWKAPPPIQTVAKFDARLHTDQERLGETTTKDGELVMVLSYYNWRVADPERFFTKFYMRDEAEMLRRARKALGAIMRDAKNDVFGRYAFSDLVPKVESDETAAGEGAEGASAGPTVAAKPRFKEIEADILGAVRKTARTQYGIEVTQVGIMRFGLPDATTPFVFRRMQAERERYAARIRGRGMGEAKGIEARANYEGDIIVAEAEALAERHKGQGDVDAAKYNETFARNAPLHNFLRSFQALKTIINEQTVLILSTDSVLFELLNKLPDDVLGAEGGTEEPE